MTKGEARKARQAEHAARVQARMEAGDTRSARDRQTDRQRAVPARRARRKTGTRRPTWGTQAWAETRGDDLPSLDQPGDDFDMDGGY